MKKNYPALKKWYNWYINNLQQKFRDDHTLQNIFKWWDDKSSETISMNSGLDDYPRNKKGASSRSKMIPGGHIDC